MSLLDGNGTPPVIYLSIDDSLTETHFRERFAQAQKADLTLVDHGQLAKFSNTDHPVLRFSYCVNDRLFYPEENTFDVLFYCSTGERSNAPGAKERIALRRYLDQICKRRSWTYLSGTRDLQTYATAMRRARVVVNLPRTPQNRPHRVFDAMACGSALLTGLLPMVDGEPKITDYHYLEFSDFEQIEEKLAFLLTDNTWRLFGLRGYELVKERHTWAKRAKELRQIIQQEFKL